MSKVFGYPEFDSTGEMIVTTYEGDYAAMLMDIRVYKMKAGETRKFCRPSEEIAALLFNGTITFAWEDKKETVHRDSVFIDGPWCVHVSSSVEIAVTADTDAEILVQCTKNEKSFPSRLYRPEDAPWKYSGVGKFGDIAKRRVNTIFDHDICPESNMVLGEILNDKGNWSGYLPHRPPLNRRSTSSCSTVRRASGPVSWATMFTRAWTTAFPRFPAAICTRRR